MSSRVKLVLGERVVNVLPRDVSTWQKQGWTLKGEPTKEKTLNLREPISSVEKTEE